MLPILHVPTFSDMNALAKRNISYQNISHSSCSLGDISNLLFQRREISLHLSGILGLWLDHRHQNPDTSDERGNIVCRRILEHRNRKKNSAKDRINIPILPATLSRRISRQSKDYTRTCVPICIESIFPTIGHLLPPPPSLPHGLLPHR